ncbi:hypothetical protein TIFTF001_014266 [Ficus carica]|uniref:Uncharacterized protein n=1 Tax=Ficus carica TaxID=3494 RepID=A0AA88AFQ6_FICCA|nr:hypothetical protein TIFTF001_014266 [Ficus carica]
MSAALAQPSRVCLFSIVCHSHLSPKILSSRRKFDTILLLALPSASSSLTRFSDSPARLTITSPFALLAQIRHMRQFLPQIYLILDPSSITDDTPTRFQIVALRAPMSISVIC